MPNVLPAPRVVLITGAASGIGAALARMLAREHCQMLLHARDLGAQAKMEALLEQCRELGAGRCEPVYAELGSDAAVRSLVDAAGSAFGRLDQVVSNAGYARQGGVSTLSWESLDQAFGTMPATFASLVRHALPQLERSSCASVVAVSSFVAHHYRRDHLFAETAAAKAALESLVRSAALELASRGVTVNGVVPGFTAKDQAPDAGNAAAWERAARDTPTGRIGRPEEVAAAIRYLLGPDARQVTGSLLHVDGGLSSG